MDLFAWLWIGWLVAFGIVETIALVNHRRGDTFSEKVWAVISKDGRGKRPRLVLWLPVAGILVWLFIHFLWGVQ